MEPIYTPGEEKKILDEIFQKYTGAPKKVSPIKNIWKEYKIIISAVVILIGFIFYWYEYRPAQIRKACADKTSPFSSGDERVYVKCLRSGGIEK